MAMNRILAEHQRLVILRSLNETPGFDLNDSILCDVLKMYSLSCSRDQLHTQLSWLEQQGYVKVEKIGASETWVSKITQSGADVADGNITAPGIKRPRPGE